MSKRIVVDPITRIEGHLRIEADIENGKIKESGTHAELSEIPDGLYRSLSRLQFSFASQTS